MTRSQKACKAVVVSLAGNGGEKRKPPESGEERDVHESHEIQELFLKHRILHFLAALVWWREGVGSS